MDAAAMALHTRLETMNEFRAQIQGERLLYVQRDHLAPLESRLRQLEDQQAATQGRFTALALMLTVLAIVMNVAVRLWVG